jgi:hypothetical protein
VACKFEKKIQTEHLSFLLDYRIASSNSMPFFSLEGITTNRDATGIPIDPDNDSNARNTDSSR